MLSVMAKTVGPELLGQWGLATALVGPITTLTAFNLRGLLATDTAQQHPLKQYAQMRVLGMLASALLTIVAATGHWVSDGPALVPLFLALLWIQRSVEAAADLGYGALQRAGAHPTVGRSYLWRGGLGLAAFALLLWLTHSLPVALSAQAIVTALVVWRHDLPLVRALEPTWPKLQHLPWPRTRLEWGPWAHALQPLARLGGAYSLLALVPSLVATMPRWWLGRADVTALGYFTALVYGPTALSLIAGAVAQTITPPLAAARQRGDQRTITALLLRALALVGLAGGGAVAVAFVAGGPILTLLYQPTYAVYAPQLVLLLVAGSIQMMGSLAGSTLTAWREVARQRWVSLALLALTALVAPWAVTRWGLNGAVATVLVSSVAHALANWTLVLLVRRRPAVAADPSRTLSSSTVS